jgi:mono/diheme cytochrome c family protein
MTCSGFLPHKELAVIRGLALFPVIALLGAASFFSHGSSSFLMQDSSSAKPAPFVVPPDIAAQTNPVHPTPEGMAQARKMYGYDCAMCHGKDGDGKGDMAGDLKTPMKNYQDPASLKGMTDGELFYIIEKGKGDMPGEGDREKPEQLWNMVTLVRSFAKK